MSTHFGRCYYTIVRDDVALLMMEVFIKMSRLQDGKTKIMLARCFALGNLFDK